MFLNGNHEEGCDNHEDFALSNLFRFLDTHLKDNVTVQNTDIRITDNVTFNISTIKLNIFIFISYAYISG